MKMLHCAVSKNEMKNINGMKIACTLCAHAEFPPVRTHDESDIQITVIPNTTSNSGIPRTRCQNIQHLEAAIQCHPASKVQHKGFARPDSVIWFLHLPFWICENQLLTKSPFPCPCCWSSQSFG